MSIAYRKGYKYQLAETYGIQLPFRLPKEISTEWLHISRSGFLTIEKGYSWDGCSGPTIDTPSTMIPGLVHDALYQMIRKELLARRFKDIADSEFHRLLLENGTGRMRAALYHKGVVKFGHRSTLPSRQQRLYKAP